MSFPILGHPKSWIPLRFVEQCREQAMINHGQTLEQLAERGGLSYSELYMCLMRQDWKHNTMINEENAGKAIHRVFTELLQADRENLNPETLKRFYLEAFGFGKP